MSYLKQLDDSAWPIVYARFEGEATVEGFDEYARWVEVQIKRAVKTNERFVNITDTRGKMQVSPEVRRHMADWVARQEETGLSAASLGSIVVVDSMIIRGVMTAISWVSRAQMVNVSSVATAADAWKLAGELLQAAGGSLPARPSWALGKAGT